MRSIDHLSPPRTPNLSGDIPYRPRNDDAVSLSMKKGRHGGKTQKSRLELNRAYFSNEELRNPALEEKQPLRPYHSKSLPSLIAAASVPAPQTSDMQIETARTGSVDHSRRRWTLPSKAASTVTRAMTISAEHKPASSITPPGILSPAMITLRRATTVKPTDGRKLSLSFFPEPKFERSRTGFLTNFIRTVTGLPEQEPAPTWPRVEERRSSAASVGSDGAQPSHRGSASTVCSKVDGIEPTISLPIGMESSSGPGLQRCSTKYITGGQVYEVIWDENASSNSGTASHQSESQSGGPLDMNRRQSVAVNLLENQLAKADDQSRRQSVISQRVFSFNEAYERQRHGSLQSILGFKLSKLVNEAALRSVPRSKASRARKMRSPHTNSQISSSIAEEISEASESEHAPCDIEFFPPLRSRATTTTSKPEPATPPPGTSQMLSHTSPATSGVSGRSPAFQSNPFGRFIGANARLRRQRTADEFEGNGRRSSDTVTDNRRASGFEQMRLSTTVEDDTTPLLSDVGILG